MLTNPAIVGELGLSDAQVQKIQDIHTKYQTQRIDLRAQIAKKRLQLRTLWQDDNPNTTAIEKLVREIGDLRTQIAVLGVREKSEIKNVLTDEQFNKWQKMRFEMMGQRMGRGMRGTPHGQPMRPFGDGGARGRRGW